MIKSLKRFITNFGWKITVLYTLSDEDDLRKNPFLLLKDILQFAIEIADGMAFIASKGIIHNDLSTKNVFMTDLPNGKLVVKVGDLGLARKLDGEYYWHFGKSESAKSLSLYLFLYSIGCITSSYKIEH